MTLTLVNSAGTAKYPAQLDPLYRTPITSLLLGTTTLARRAGNPGTVYWCSSALGASQNAYGLPNPGMGEIYLMLRELVEIAHSHGKLLRISVLGYTHEEVALLVYRAALAGVDEIEINTSCPNEGKPGVLLCYDAKALKDMLTLVVRCNSLYHGTLIVKLGPFEDRQHLRECGSAIREAEALNLRGETRRIDGVVLCNTKRTTVRVENGVPVINSPDGYCGEGGASLTETALQNVAWWAEDQPSLWVEGVGGIGMWPSILPRPDYAIGRQVAAFLERGARGVQIGTAYLEYGPGIFSTALEELAEVRPDLCE